MFVNNVQKKSYKIFFEKYKKISKNFQVSSNSFSTAPSPCKNKRVKCLIPWPVSGVCLLCGDYCTRTNWARHLKKKHKEYRTSDTGNEVALKCLNFIVMFSSDKIS